MARPKLLTDASSVKSIVDEYIKQDKPTLSGLVLKLGLKTLNSLWLYMDEDSEIGDLLTDAYLHIINVHETRLFDKVCVGSLFWLKTVRRLGFRFNEYAGEPVAGNGDHKLVIEVVDRNAPNQTK